MWCKHDCKRGDEHHPERDDGEQSIGVGGAAVLVVLDVAYELRNEYGVECATGNQDRDDVGKGVSKAVGIGCDEEAERGGHGDIARKPGHS